MKLDYPNYNKYTLKTVRKVLNSGKVNYWTGNECKNFENEFSKYHKVKHSITVSNGSVALEIALKALNLKNKDSVIVSPRSFIISASCVLNLGLKPIFADVDYNGNLNIEGIKKVYNKQVKAIIIVHLNGLACDLDPILKFVKKNNIYLIEDCSQAHGAIYKGNKVGSFGDISTLSFCQDKIISTGGEGGMISTDKKKLWLKCWSLKDHGKNYNKKFNKKNKNIFNWLHDDLGSNYRMTEIQATIGRYQLKNLDNQIKRRNKVAMFYLRHLKDYFSKYKIIKKPNFKCESCPLLHKTEACNNCRHAFYRLNLFFENNIKINQTKIIRELLKFKVNCGVGPCPEIYREKVFKKLNHKPKKRLKNAKILGEKSLVFPINPFKSFLKLKRELNIIKKVLDKNIL